MDLSCLTHLVAETLPFRHLLQRLKAGKTNCETAVLEAARPYLLAALQQELSLPLLVVVPSPEKAKRLYEQLLNWCGNEVMVLHFPEPDSLPYEHLSSDIPIMQERLQVLSRVSSLGQSLDSQIPLVVASASAIAQKTLAFSDFSSASHTVSPGMHIPPSELLSRWKEMGYEIETKVEVSGTASRRGGIVDIYPQNLKLPLRIEFSGDEIESLRTFDPQNQRSLKPTSSAWIAPATEMMGAATGIIFDYLPQKTLIVLDEPADIEGAVEELDAQATRLRQEEVERGELSGDSPAPYLSWSELETRLKGVKPCLVLNRWSAREDLHLFASAPSYGGQLTLFLEQVREMLQEGYRLILISHQASRLSELLREEDVFISPVSHLEHLPSSGSLALIQGSLAEGWRMEEVILLTDAEIFGFVKQQRLVKPRPVRRDLFPELAIGDYAVHTDYGIARFAGITKMGIDEVEREYLVLEYAAGDKLYVPSEQADRISRYIGSGEEPPSLSRLGTQEWARVRQRVKESTRDMAQDLLTLYATREVVPGFAFFSDTPWQEELEASFPYPETPDQLEAVQQIKEDMEKPKPMDRLVCGDVGYGKTEVALRAAFKAVMNGKQVAVLVPTTVLAQQHLTTFAQRLSAFPVKVEMLSRFRSGKEQQAILEGLANKTIDICIGTHRLLQKDVTFKDLGLVIIDEEQRFGVAHKERLKQMRKEVDVLTLSATPIPRTLHMSLVGVRDVSTMETPPEERLPIKTFVSGYDESLIREAIIREMERNGQVFFVHNRVQSIPWAAHQLGGLAPEARIAVAHGQMPEEELERVMFDFTQGKVDVLVCTTIIESGLDIPNVNTLIVNEADKLGLTQLYQLRGRVGRGSNRAYAYFLFSKGKQLTSTAKKRLQTIFEATELGAGFHIAMRDLEIRGAGNLLGPEQSGHIAAVGFEFYCQLLGEAVEELKEKIKGERRIPPVEMPTIDLPLPAYIPEEYVWDLRTRLTLYRRLAKVRAPEEVKQLAEEFEDRFGELPPAVKNLLYMLNIKVLATKAGIQSISREDRQVVIRFREEVKIGLPKLEKVQDLKVMQNQLRLDIKRLGDRWQGTLEDVVVRLSSAH